MGFGLFVNVGWVFVVWCVIAFLTFCATCCGFALDWWFGFISFDLVFALV